MSESAVKSESKYERLRKIGIGSYGVVFKCVNRQSGQIVAIKRYSENDSDPIIRKIAMREVRMLRQLNHPNLINLIEVFRRKRRLHLVFDYCELTVLDVIEKYGNSCPVNLIRKIVWQIVNGINYCHTHNCIHRDIKPENILINGQGVVKLCDFGFARNFEQGQLLSSSSNKTNSINSSRAKQVFESQENDKENSPTSGVDRQALTEYVATRWYRAPELLIGEIYYDVKIDIWALGCVTAELMRGDPVWPGKTDLDQLFMIKSSLGQLTSSQTHTLLTQNIYDQTNIERLLNQTCNANDSLERKLPISRVGQSGVNFVIACLQMDPKCRPTSDELLNHGYIQSARMVQFMKEANSNPLVYNNHFGSNSVHQLPANSYKGNAFGGPSLGTEQVAGNFGTTGGRLNSQSLLMIANSSSQKVHPSIPESCTSKTPFLLSTNNRQQIKESELPSVSSFYGADLYALDKVKSSRLQSNSNVSNINNKPTKRPKQPIYDNTGGQVINPQAKIKELKKSQYTNRSTQQQLVAAKEARFVTTQQQFISSRKSGASKLPVTTTPSGKSTTLDRDQITRSYRHLNKRPVLQADVMKSVLPSTKVMISRKYSKSNSNLPLTSASTTKVPLADQTNTYNTSNVTLDSSKIAKKATTYQQPRTSTVANVDVKSTFLISNTLDSSASSSSISETTLNTMRSSSISYLPKIVQPAKHRDAMKETGNYATSTTNASLAK